MSKLIQLHHQWVKNGKTVKTEMMMQVEVDNLQEVSDYAVEAHEKYPLPDGAQWLFVMEGSRHFVMTKEEGNDER